MNAPRCVVALSQPAATRIGNQVPAGEDLGKMLREGGGTGTEPVLDPYFYM